MMMSKSTTILYMHGAAGSHIYIYSMVAGIPTGTISGNTIYDKLAWFGQADVRRDKHTFEPPIKQHIYICFVGCSPTTRSKLLAFLLLCYAVRTFIETLYLPREQSNLCLTAFPHQACPARRERETR